MPNAFEIREIVRKIYLPQDMKIYIKILTLLTLCYLCNACQLYEEKRKSGTIAEYNGKTITGRRIREDILKGKGMRSAAFEIDYDADDEE